MRHPVQMSLTKEQEASGLWNKITKAKIGSLMVLMLIQVLPKGQDAPQENLPEVKMLTAWGGTNSESTLPLKTWASTAIP